MALRPSRAVVFGALLCCLLDMFCVGFTCPQRQSECALSRLLFHAEIRQVIHLALCRLYRQTEPLVTLAQDTVALARQRTSVPAMPTDLLNDWLPASACWSILVIAYRLHAKAFWSWHVALQPLSLVRPNYLARATRWQMLKQTESSCETLQL